MDPFKSGSAWRVAALAMSDDPDADARLVRLFDLLAAVWGHEYASEVLQLGLGRADREPAVQERVR